MTKLLTQFARLFILIVLGVSLSSPALAQEEKKPSGQELSRLLYRPFKDVESFGWIFVAIKGDDAKKIGLFEGALTNYMKLRFKNNFAKIKYKEVPREKWTNLFANKTNAQKVGYLYCAVWVVGDNYPIAYHVKCNAGNFDNTNIWRDAVLGYGSKDTVPGTIKETLNGSMEKLAIEFFKVRGEM